MSKVGFTGLISWCLWGHTPCRDSCRDSVPGPLQPLAAFLGLWLLPHLQSQEQSISNLIQTLRFHGHCDPLTLTLPPPSRKDTCDCMRPTQIIQDIFLSQDLPSNLTCKVPLAVKGNILTGSKDYSLAISGHRYSASHPGGHTEHVAYISPLN